MRVYPVIFFAIFAIGLLFAPSASAEPLFEDDDILTITIEGPIKDLKRKAKRSTDSYDAFITVQGEQALPIKLSARGKTRRQAGFCRFPPLRVRFESKPDAPSVFEGQKGIKLVTHCRDGSAYANNVLMEMAAYEIFGQISPYGLKVRRVSVRYIDGGKVIDEGVGFFIEDADSAAKRNGIKEVDSGRIARTWLAPDAAAEVALFEWLIGNLDWSMLTGPDATDCCHNVKLMGQSNSAKRNLIPVPYDFDHSGLVNAPYAKPPDGMGLRSVRQRKYRGFCDHNEEFDLAANRLLSQKSVFLAIIDNTAGLDSRRAERAKAFLNSGFVELANPDKRARIKQSCR